MGPFLDRRAAGRQLAALLGRFARQPDALVLALPRGGVPVAYEVAAALSLPLDLFIVRKLGVPGHEELAFGAIAPGGVRVLSEELVEALGITAADIERVTVAEERELVRRDREYREGAPPPAITGQTVLLVDDGLATGASMRAAVAAIRIHRPRRIIVAVPVATSEAIQALRGSADDVIAVMTPKPFGSVGSWYVDFSQTTDDEVRNLLHDAKGRAATRVTPWRASSNTGG
jgi:predicted phosphoribosyltransferase